MSVSGINNNGSGANVLFDGAEFSQPVSCDDVSFVNDSYGTLVGIEDRAALMSIPSSNIGPIYWSNISRCCPVSSLSDELKRKLRPNIKSFYEVLAILKKFVNNEKYLEGELKKLDPVSQARVLIVLNQANPELANKFLSKDPFSTAGDILDVIYVLDESSGEQTPVLTKPPDDNKGLPMESSVGVFTVLGVIGYNKNGLIVAEEWKDTSWDVDSAIFLSGTWSFGLGSFSSGPVFPWIMVRQTKVEPKAEGKISLSEITPEFLAAAQKYVEEQRVQRERVYEAFKMWVDPNSDQEYLDAFSKEYDKMAMSVLENCDCGLQKASLRDGGGPHKATKTIVATVEADSVDDLISKVRIPSEKLGGSVAVSEPVSTDKDGIVKITITITITSGER